MNLAKKKTFILIGVVLLYVTLGLAFKYMVDSGVVSHLDPRRLESVGASLHNTSTEYYKSLEDAKSFVKNVLKKEEGNVVLYVQPENNSVNVLEGGTNSEAMSYYVLWNVMEGNKEEVDEALDYIEEKMLHPDFGYMMWKVDSQGRSEGEARNIASDADLRLIRALAMAEDKWGDERYSDLISVLEGGLRQVAVTRDNYLAPYGGVSGANSTWTGDEVWISYMDFEAVKTLEERFGKPWGEVYDNMKNATLGAQIHNGLYNSMLTKDRKYGNGIDGGAYSINSLWIMVRSSASEDEELRKSARKSLDFYKEEFRNRGKILSIYDSSGNPVTESSSPWAYALVGRAAVNLEDDDFADSMIKLLIDKQVSRKTSPVYGGFMEAYQNGTRVGQFTTQESLLTLIDYKDMKANVNMGGDN